LHLLKRLSAKPNGDRVDDRLRKELLKLLYETMPVVLAVNLANGTIIAAVFVGSLSSILVVGWWILLVIMIGLRTAALLGYRRDDKQRKNWASVAVVGSGCSGVLWGVAGFFFNVPGDETYRLVLVFILAGMAAGAVNYLTAHLPAFFAFMFPMGIPFILRLLLDGTPNHVVIAGACSIYLCAVIFIGRRCHSWLVDSLLLRFENADLVQSLERRVEERTAQLTESNERLSKDIVERQRAEATLADFGDRQAAVSAFGQRALTGVDLETLCNEAVTLVANGLGVSQSAIWEHVPETRSFVLRADKGLPVHSKPSVALPDGWSSPVGFAFGTATSITSDNLGSEQRFTPNRFAHLSEAASVAEVLIPGGDRPFGVLEVGDRDGRSFADGDISFMQSIANMLAAAIERIKVEQDIQRMALEDPLTGLPNRALFRDHLQQGLARIKRSGGLLAVLLIDLDHFKDVNDTLGHPTGDRLLAEVAERLRGSLRQSDPPARLGGDEFALILPDLPSPENAASVAQKVISQLAKPFYLDEHEIYFGGSVGITICPTDGDDADRLLRNADLALYRAKKEGRNTYQFYAPDMTLQVEARKSLERDLRHAISGHEFALHFQPQYDVVDNRLIGAEALLRWWHPRLGALMPGEFIPVAEASGLVVPLGAWVLERACEHAHAWRRSRLPPVITAVNMSPSQCRRGDLVKTIDRIARRAGGDLGWLELEVTEQLFMPPDDVESVTVLRRLRERGATISIDDFGKGYSSLGRLQGLPVNKVKIDKCFVRGLGRSRDAELIVRAIIALCRSLGLMVIAEGVESEEQLSFLRAEGCHAAQGYHLGRPMPADLFTRLLREHARRSA